MLAGGGVVDAPGYFLHGAEAARDAAFLQAIGFIGEFVVEDVDHFEGIVGNADEIAFVLRVCPVAQGALVARCLCGLEEAGLREIV